MHRQNEYRRLSIQLSFLWALLFSFSVHASIETGLQWLTAQSDSAGGYATDNDLATAYQTTVETLLTFDALDQNSSIDVNAALAYINADTVTNSVYLARKIIVNAQLGHTTTALVDTLKTRAFRDGGFGDFEGFQTTVIDTVWVLKALQSIGETHSETAIRAMAYLLNNQQSNGGWSDGGNSTGVYLSALVAGVLTPYQAQYPDVANALTSVRNYLFSQQAANGLWLSDFETALTLLALTPIVSDSAILQASIDALIERQLADGSWSQDVFTTALATRALALFDRINEGNTGNGGTATLTGYVVLAGTGQPLSGVTVSPLSEPGMSVTTDADGFYVLSELNAGQYTLLAQKPGYSGASLVVTAVAGQIASADNLILSINDQTGIVSGTIRDAQDLTPLANVNVGLQGNNNYSAVTDAQGYYEILSVLPGAYQVSIQKSGFYPVTGTVAVVTGQRLIIDNQLVREGAFLDDEPVDVRAVIIDAISQSPLSGADLILDNGRTSRSGADGEVLITNLARGSYQGEIKLPGYRSVNLGLLLNPGASGDLGQISINPETGGAAADHLTLLGKVIDGVTGLGIAYAQITRLENGVSWSADENGDFIADEITDLQSQFRIAAADYETQDVLLTASGFGEINQSFVLSPAGDEGLSQSQFSGTVFDLETGVPIADALIAVEGTQQSTLSDSNGEYSLTDITATEFSVNVGKPGYHTLIRDIQLSAHGDYQVDFNLEAIDADTQQNLQIVTVSQPQTAKGAGQSHLFEAQIANLTEAIQEALIIGELFNSQGESVGVVSPYLPDTTTVHSRYEFQASEVKTLTIPWLTKQLAPGTYRLALRVVESGSISGSLPTGVIIDEFNSYADIEATKAIDGVLAINPPLAQVGSQTPVSLDVLVLNSGNIDLAGAQFDLTIDDPDTGATVHSATAVIASLPVGNNISLSFGEWTPSVVGHAPISVSPSNSEIAGTIAGIYYVGDKATGSFTLDRTIVPEGTQTVRATISLESVDTTQGNTIDPLVFAVRNAVKTGAEYTAANGIAWHKLNRCLGCHIQTQSLIGVTSAFHKNLGDEFESKTFFNMIASSQQDNGMLSNNRSRETKTQTALGMWSLTAWQDPKSLFRTLYKATKHMYDRRNQLGDRSWWNRDHKNNTAWWRTTVAHTALVIKGFVKLLTDAENIDLSTIYDYRLNTISGFGSGINPSDIEFGPDGWLYTIKRSGSIVRTDPDSGTHETIVSGLAIDGFGIAVDHDGSIYVSGLDGKLLRRNPDGSIDTLLTGAGSLRDVDIGPDGMLYIADNSQHRILKVTPNGQLKVLASGGLLQDPYGITFDEEGDLFIANLSGFNILKLDVSNQLSVFADGLAYPPIFIDFDSVTKGFYYTSNLYSKPGQNTPNGINFLSKDGIVERIIGNNRLFGVAVSGQTVFTTNKKDNGLHELSKFQLNTGLLNTFRTHTQRAANYLLSVCFGSTNNIVQAMCLMGLAEARTVITDAGKLSEIEIKIQTIANRLRNRQHSDGGWGRYTSWDSDPMVTALVGLSMDYTNPSSDDPMVRSAILYLLSTQHSDHSWSSPNRILKTRLAATSLVVAYLPIALERLGGIDVDLHLEFPENITLSNPGLAATDQETFPDATSHYHWFLRGVTSEARDIEFDLTFRDMMLDETRIAADRTYLEFENSFTGEILQSDLPIPALKVKSALGLTVETDNAMYQANETVNISLTAANAGLTASDGYIELSIRTAANDELVATLAPVPFTALSAGAELTLPGDWFTGTTLAGDYQVHGAIYDSLDRKHDQDVAAFKIIHEGTSIDSTVTTDKPVYQAWDQVQLTGRVFNTSENVIHPEVLAETIVTAPDGAVIYSQVYELDVLLPTAIRDVPGTLALVDATGGEYQVTVHGKDAFSHDILTTSHSAFTVNRQLIQAIDGSVVADPVQVYQGDPTECTETVSTIASSSIDNVLLTSQLYSLDTGKLVQQSQRTVTLHSGQTLIYTRTIETETLEVGSYACVLTGEVGGHSRRLGLAGFDVLEPPINIDAQLTPGERGRVLILLDKTPEVCTGVSKMVLETTMTTPLDELANVRSNLTDNTSQLLDTETGVIDSRLINVNAGPGNPDLTIDEFSVNHLSLQIEQTPTLTAPYQINAEISAQLGNFALVSNVIDPVCPAVVKIGDTYGDYRVTNLQRLPAADDPLGSNHQPDLITQRDVLETLLTEAGWSYTIVTDADSFTREFHTGGYVTYMLLSEQVKLSEAVQKQLREAVWRGEGLIEAGSHDQRQGRIDEALGVSFHGKHPEMHGVTLLESAVGAAAQAGFSLQDKILRATLNGAEAIAYFQLDGETGEDIAATVNEYGAGRTLYAGFDLLAEASTPGGDASHDQLLLNALNYVHPETLTANAGGVYPVRITLTNQGIATPGRLSLQYPASVKVIDAGGGEQQSDTLIWPFDLLEEQTLIFNSWMQLPDETIQLAAIIATGETPDFELYDSLSLEITPEAEITIEEILIEVQALDRKTYKQVIKYLEWAQQDQDNREYAEALSALLRAADELIKIGSEQSDTLRSQVAQSMRQIAANLE